MNSRTILASSAALLFSIMDPAAGQELPKPAPDTVDIPGLPGPIGPPKRVPAGRPSSSSNVPGAGAPPTVPAVPGLDVIPGAVPGLEAIPGTAPVEPIKREPSTRTGPEIIREAKLKVLRKHYEEALSETIQLEKAALSASPEERSKMDAKTKAHRDFLGKLEADLDALATPPKTAAVEKSRPLKAIPGLDVPSSAETGPIPGGYQVPKARAELEKVKELEKSGLIGKLDVIKAETRLKWAEAHAVGDRAGAARATRDGARQRLELMRTLFAGGVVSAEEIDEVRRELRAADADLRVQLEATGEGGSEGTPGAPSPARK